MGMNGYAQPFYEAFYGNRPDDNMPLFLMTQPHSLDDFLGRFNGQHNAYGKILDKRDPAVRAVFSSPASIKAFRRLVIGSLLHPSLLKRDSMAADAFAAAASESEQLDFLSSDWWVEIPLHGSHKGKQVEVVLRLKPEADERQRIRWSITGAAFLKGKPEGKVPAVLPERCDELFIPPSAHDNGFIALRRILREERNLAPYLQSGGAELAALQYLLQDSSFIVDFKDFMIFFKPRKGPAFQMNDQWLIIGI